jgi:hypothetical protein
MTFNFFKNVFGLRIWTNTPPLGGPFTKFALPDYLRAGVLLPFWLRCSLIT